MAIVIVTGGAGFVGSHLCDRLLEIGHEVVCIDNLSTGKRHNIAHLQGHAAFTFFDADICAPVPWSGKADYLFHLASPASPVAYFQMPLQTAMTNALGTYNVLELARSQGAHFLIASTSEVYGDPLSHPQDEGYWGNVNPTGPRSPYDEGKRFAEMLTMSYYRQYDLDTRIVRIFNTYGPRCDPNDGRMVPNFIRQALTAAPITVYGDGNQTRSICYVDDLVEGLLLAMFSPVSRGEVFNLGNPEEHKVIEYAQLIREICGSSSEIRLCPARVDDPYRRCPDITKARKYLGWEPSISLRAGLEATVGWTCEQLFPGRPSTPSADRKDVR